MADVSKQAEEWLSEHPDATKKEISFVVSFIFISKARAERDSYNQKLVHATQQLDSYVAAYGNLKSK